MKKIICLCLALIFSLSCFAFAFADGGTIEGVGGNMTTTAPGSGDIQSAATEDYSINTSSKNLFGVDKKEVTVDQITNKINSKGRSVVSLLKAVCEYVCIGAFIVCCVLAAIGAVQKGPLLGKALIGAVLAAVAYGAIVYAEDIIAIVVAFLSN